MDTQHRQSLIKVVNHANIDALRRLIIKRAEYDPSFLQDVTAQFGELDTQTELAATKKTLQEIIKINKHHGILDDVGCDNVCEALDDMVDNYMRRLEQGYVSHAMDGLLLVIAVAGRLFNTADSSVGPLTATFNNALDAIRRLSLKASKHQLSDDQKNELIKKIVSVFRLKRFDDWPANRYHLILVSLPLITSKTIRIVKNASTAVTNRAEEGYDQTQSRTYDKILNANLLYYMGKKDQAKRYLDRYMNSPEIREQRIRLALHDKEFKMAERLCLDASQQDPGWRRIWEQYLIKIYNGTDQRQKQEEILKRELFRGTLSAYEPLKQLIQEDGFWDVEGPKLIAQVEKTLPPVDYAEILAEEHKYAELLQVVRHNPKIVTTYGKTLYARFPKQIDTLYYHQIILNNHAVSRKADQRLAHQIQDYAAYGKKQLAIAWIDQLLAAHPKRAALAEALTPLEMALKHQ
ncbi:hypothetical protein YK48G_12640 [Lentilactobacillus fungorum]|uniref:Uncharacterized protein n=1 Tax=Lentilactobacillus fungorum TaxID=2201250 RepID=A0ABQ3W2F7_9LACO|nr:hypothetical protein [Lentilactobacillus fungorum]GHP13839.1 hypothetical protein YK48G_12640 [Lentilactobacillus fungorum]